MTSQKTLVRRIAALEQMRNPRRCFHFWDNQDGQVQPEIAAMKENGEIGDGDQVRIFSWMPAAPASGAPDDICASTKSLNKRNERKHVEHHQRTALERSLFVAPLTGSRALTSRRRN
jgi:hypothetical protein